MNNLDKDYLEGSYCIKKYTVEYSAEWDEFVMERSLNGTFLQTRRFLAYHPRDRFDDCSLMIYDEKERLSALIPACTIYMDSEKVFFSHKGSTFGGILYDERHNNAACIKIILSELLIFLRKQKYRKIYIKITPDIFCRENSSLLQYMLFNAGFSEYTELNTYVDLQGLNDDIVMDFSATKRKHIRRLAKKNLKFKFIEEDEEIALFYQLLECNLSKYNVKPIHSFEEIIDLKNNRIPEHVQFCGVFMHEQMLAAGMLFDFGKNKVVHAQNLSSNPYDREVDAIEYLYYSVIKEYKQRGYGYLSWGISTENAGTYLNMGLIRNKESYGSKYYLNRTFYKELVDERHY